VASHLDIPSGNLRGNQLLCFIIFENVVRLFGFQTAYRSLLGLMQYLSRLRILWFKKKLLYIRPEDLEGFSVFPFQERGCYHLPYILHQWLKLWLNNIPSCDSGNFTTEVEFEILMSDVHAIAYGLSTCAPASTRVVTRPILLVQTGVTILECRRSP
jgi:hypothetical protein